MCLGVVFCHCLFDILLCDGLTAFLHCQQCLTFSLFTVLSYTTLEAKCPSGWLSNTDALGSVEQEYRLVSWSTFTTVSDSCMLSTAFSVLDDVIVTGSSGHSGSTAHIEVRRLIWGD